MGRKQNDYDFRSSFGNRFFTFSYRCYTWLKRGYNEMQKTTFIAYVFAFFSLLFCTAFAIQTYRLGSTRQQLAEVRAELQLATNRQSEIKELVGRAGEILNQSSVTIKDVREQIREIRKNYEVMESLLLNYNSNNVDSDDSTAHQEKLD